MSGTASGVPVLTGQVTRMSEGAAAAPVEATSTDIVFGTSTRQSTAPVVLRFWSIQRSAPFGSGVPPFRFATTEAVRTTGFVRAPPASTPSCAYRWPDSHAITSDERPYAANATLLPDSRRRCCPWWDWSTEPGITT
jgi:hypothetical protein